jgi:transposase
LQYEQIVRIKIEAFALDLTSIKVHPDGAGSKKRISSHRQVARRMEHQGSSGRRECSYGHNLRLSPGHAHDAPALLLAERGPQQEGLPLLVDRAYEGDETGQLVLSLGMIRIVPPKSPNRIEPWEYDRALYKKREIERLFRRLESFRRIFSRFEKLDVPFLGFPQLRPHHRSASLM